MTITQKDRQLFNQVKKIALKLQHLCRLKNVELGDLIQWGCVACLDAKAKPNEVEQIAKKAILENYRKEYKIQKTQRSTFGILDERSIVPKIITVENIVPSPEPESIEERLERDSIQGKEWSDLDKPLQEYPQLKQDLEILKDYGLKPYCYKMSLRYKNLQIKQAYDIINGTSEQLNENIKFYKQYKLKYLFRPFIDYVAFKLNVQITDIHTKNNIKMSLFCPLNQKCLTKVFPQFNEYIPKDKHKIEYTIRSKQRDKALSILKSRKELK